MKSLIIILGSILAAVIYGVVHDQFTVRICLEYFTIGHPPLFWAYSPTLLALSWGIIATWWVGLLLGILFAASARMGRWPKTEPRQLLIPILKLLLVMAIGSVSASIIGYTLARLKMIQLVGELSQAVPYENHAAFLSAGWAHGAGYLFGIIGGIIPAIKILAKRKAIGTQLIA
jgi:hypothetical protein